MTEDNSAGSPAEATKDSPPGGGSDDRVAAVRLQRDVAQQTGDREAAQEFDALERELYEAEAGDGGPEVASADDSEAPVFAEADHAPLTGDETAGVFAFLDEVDPAAAAALRAEWSGDAAANLGYAHLWFTTQHTQDERDSMVVTPGLVRMAARMGRRLAADRRAPGSSRRAGDGDAATEDRGALGERAAEIRRRKQEALRAGDHRRAQELDEQERAAWARLHGDAPIVGRAGRRL